MVIKKLFSMLLLTVLCFSAYAQAPLPHMHAVIAGRSMGEISKVVFSAQEGVVPQMNRDEKLQEAWKDYRFLVTRFDIVITRDNKQVYFKNVKGAKFDKETVTFMQTVKPGDQVRISNVYCNISPINKVIPLDPIDLRIK